MFYKAFFFTFNLNTTSSKRETLNIPCNSIFQKRCKSDVDTQEFQGTFRNLKSQNFTQINSIIILYFGDTSIF